MAHSYYSPRRARSHSVSDVPSSTDEEQLPGDLEQSIFIFPSPTTRGMRIHAGNADADTDPPSPLSIPTDASFPSTQTNSEDVSRGRRISNASGFSAWTFSGRSVSADTTSLRSPLVELWEMSESEDHGATVPPHRLQQQQQQRLPLGTRPVPSQFVFSDGRFHLRARKESAYTSADSVNEAAPPPTLTADASAPAPDAEASPHLPLLAFFASLLSVNDATLRLLTHPSTDHASPLFLDGRLYPVAIDSTIHDEKRTANFSESPTASLKAGMEVSAADPDPSLISNSVFTLPIPLPVPPLPFAYVLNLMKEFCATAVPQKVRLTARAT